MNRRYTARLLYDVEGWAYYRRCLALQKYAPDDFQVSKGPDYGAAFKRDRSDLVLQLCYSCTRNLRQHIDSRGYNTVLVSGFNIGWGYANGWFKPVQQFSDHVVINNRECWEKLGRLPNTTWISNGVDREIYRPTVSAGDRKPKVLWVGSKIHSQVKGYETILCPLGERLKRYAIESDFRVIDSLSKGRWNAQQMNHWYNTGTIYVVASKSEGTPNPALEAASAGCIVVSTRVGNMPELIEHGVNGELVDRNVDLLLEAILRCQDRYVEMAAMMQDRIESWHWKHRAVEYFDLFRQLINTRNEERKPRQGWVAAGSPTRGLVSCGAEEHNDDT